jgi:23S rRNA (uracil1939-C5)-methyltransferase
MTNIRFRCGDSATAEEEGLHFDCVVIDPPRKGCSPQMLDALVRLNPRRIVYVSCNPATLARDAAVLSEKGWQIVRARPFDMFPRTGHCETVTLWTKENPS